MTHGHIIGNTSLQAVVSKIKEAADIFHKKVTVGIFPKRKKKNIEHSSAPE